MSTIFIYTLLLLYHETGAIWHIPSKVIEHFDEHLGTVYPVLISKEGADEYLKTKLILQHPTTMISYEPNRDEDWVIKKLNELRQAGNLNLIIFLNSGHKGLLKMLVNEQKLFNSEISGMCEDLDFSYKELKLRLDTRLYYYTLQKDRIDFTETYAVNEVLVTNKIGLWNESYGLAVPPPNMANIWKRRTNLHGMTVNVVSVNRRYLHEIYYEGNPVNEYRPPRSRVPDKAVIGGGGIFIEPLNILSSKLNFTLNLTASFDNKWGSVDKEGKWNGMIGQVVRGESDIAAASLTRTLMRDEVTSFSITLMNDFSDLAAPITTKRKVQLWVYLELLPPATWGILMTALLGIAICITLVSISGALHDINDPETFGFLNGIGLSVIHLMQLSYPIKDFTLSSRVLLFVSGMALYLVFEYYIADLTGTMTAGPGKHTVRGFDDVLNGDYNILVKKSTAMFEQLENAIPGSAKHKVYLNKVKDNPAALVKDLKEAMEKMADSDKTLFFYTSTGKFITDHLNFLITQG